MRPLRGNSQHYVSAGRHLRPIAALARGVLVLAIGMARAYARSRQRSSRNCREVDIALHLPRLVCAAAIFDGSGRCISSPCPANMAAPISHSDERETTEETDVMAKGQQRSNRETKKPKKDKVKASAAAPSRKEATWQPEIG